VRSKTQIVRPFDPAFEGVIEASMSSDPHEVPSIGQINHLLAIIALLADGVSWPGPTPEILEHIRNLAEPDRDLPDALVLADWRQQLSGFIEEIRGVREVRRQKALAAVSAARLDQATGLPGSTAAQAEIEKAVLRDQAPRIAVLVLEQLRLLNARFGRSVGDEIFTFAASELSRLLADFGVLFRWNGPAFLLVTSAAGSKGGALEEKLSELATNRIDRIVQIEDRSIHVKITFSWHIHPLAPGEGIIQISRALDDAVACRVRSK
jgi:GGDEF domain-containing protein